MKAGWGALAVLGACALLPAAARAGTDDVYSCKFGSSFYGDNAWVGVNNSGGGDPTLTAPDANSNAQLQLTGSRVTIEDLRPPILSEVQAGTGLLAPGSAPATSR